MLEKISFINYSNVTYDIGKLMHGLKGETTPVIVEKVPDKIYRAIVDGLLRKPDGNLYLLYVPSMSVWTFDQSNITIGSVDRLAGPSSIFTSITTTDFLYYPESHVVYKLSEPFAVLAGVAKKNELHMVIS
jgi:hypothetical protein